MSVTLADADRALAAELVDRLNALLEDDACRAAIGMLLQVRIAVADPMKGLLDHPTLQVTKESESFTSIGALGFLNGMVGARPGDSCGYIGAVFETGEDGDKTPGSLVRFVLMPDPK